MAQTRLQLRDEAKQRANQESKTLVLDPEWNRYIDEAISELYDLVIDSFPHYYLSSYAFTLSSSNQVDISALNPLFYKLRGLDYLFAGSTKPQTVSPLAFAERNRFGSLNYAGNYTLWYNKQPPTLAADGNSLDFILSVWEEFVPVTAAIAAASKEESSTDALNERRAQIIERINRAAPNRDGEPGQAADLTFPQDCGRRYMLEGANLIVVGSDAWDWA